LLLLDEPEKTPETRLLLEELGLVQEEGEGREERLSVGEVEMLPLPQALPLPPPPPPTWF